MLNETSITVSHPSTVERYKNMGVEFKETERNGYVNLTMIAPAILPMNNTTVYCTVIGDKVVHSTKVYLFLYDNFGELTGDRGNELG